MPETTKKGKKGEKKKIKKRKQKIKQKILVISKKNRNFSFQLFGFTPLNFPRLVVKTASPGPEVSVPTLGSWEYGV